MVAEAAALSGCTIVGFIDDAISEGFLGGYPILRIEHLEDYGSGIIVAIGEAAARKRVQSMHAAAKRSISTVVHPRATVSPSVSLGKGVFVGPNAVVNAEAKLGDGVIVNSRAVVEHHCEVGPFSHIAPGVTLGGGVQVGAMTLIGLGASVLPGIRIGSDSIVGAGSVVRDEVASQTTVVGCPARPVAN